MKHRAPLISGEPFSLFFARLCPTGPIHLQVVLLIWVLEENGVGHIATVIPFALYCEEGNM